VALYRERGWLQHPDRYHRRPPVLEAPRIHSRTTLDHRGSLRFEHLSFESGYRPHAGEPGAGRWLSYEACRTAHAWMLRHPGPPRPWLVCIHGYMMGVPAVDFALFNPRRLHRQYGLNLLFPVLPMHGPRRVNRLSGNGYIAGDALDTIHAQAQAVWDLRRLVGWLRCQDAPRIGVYGVSLGGYNASLLAALENGLDLIMAGIPATDLTSLMWLHGPATVLRRLHDEGLTRERMSTAMRVISPLALSPVAGPRLAVFGGRQDRLVPPDQVQALADHWPTAHVQWFDGAHLCFGMEREVGRFMTREFGASGLLPAQANPPSLSRADG
jgi:pimeloyl-ACP methyl ester carboxylesterase